MLVALPMLFTAWTMRKPIEHGGSMWAKGYARAEWGLRQLWFLAGFAFVCIALGQEAGRTAPVAKLGDLPVAVLAPYLQTYAVLLAILAAMALADRFGERKEWAVARWPGRLSLLLLAFGLLVSVAEGRHMLYLPDLPCWIAGIGLHVWLLRRQPVSRWTQAMHVGGVLLATAIVADWLWLGIDRGALWDTSWAGVSYLVSATAILFLLVHWAGKSARAGEVARFAWPLDPYARAYWWHGALVIALLVYFGALITCLVAEGVTNPLPYIPVLNPVDLSALLALGALALWRRMLQAAELIGDIGRVLAGRTGLAAMAVLAFIIANTIWLRTAHHVLGIAWDAQALGGSQVVQSGYSILWTLIAMGLMFLASKRKERLPWLAGAVLLAVVVAKLALLDMSQIEGLARIVAFIAVGVLMLLIGYFVPIPPRAQEPREAEA